MAAQTRSALFIYKIYNDDAETSLEFRRPVPARLCRPGLSPNNRQDYATFVKTVVAVNKETHQACMQKITSPCVQCQRPATDALKSPMSYLHLAQPMIITIVTQVCGSKVCERGAQQGMAGLQEKVMGYSTTVSARGGRPAAESVPAAESPPAEDTVPAGNSVPAEDSVPAEVGAPSEEKDACATCGKGSASRQRARCGKVVYCNRACLRKDMKNHEASCVGQE